jgi:hypothetical protein
MKISQIYQKPVIRSKETTNYDVPLKEHGTILIVPTLWTTVETA